MSAQEWLKKLNNSLLVGGNGKGTIKNYVAEMRLLFQYYNDRDVEVITSQDITNYIVFIKQHHLVGYAKCRGVAHACSYFFKHVIKTPFVLPSVLYPKKQFKLPKVMLPEEVKVLFSHVTCLKTKCILGLLYGSGMRLNEVVSLKITDIESKNSGIRIIQGKNHKDRLALLPLSLLNDLRSYYKQFKPKVYLFESPQTKSIYHSRSVQLIVSQAMKQAGLYDKGYTSHTLRHSFATHLLNSGVNIHTVKELLGHSKLETTMIYLHLMETTRKQLQSPLDML